MNQVCPHIKAKKKPRKKKQGGYGGFSVSPSIHDKTKRYIENQEEHHKEKTFREEYLMCLKEYGIKYDEKYLWSD